MRPQHEVTGIAKAPDRRWGVEVNRISETGAVLERRSITCTALFLAAGSVNTSRRILVRAKAKSTVPSPPSGVGVGLWHQ